MLPHPRLWPFVLIAMSLVLTTVVADPQTAPAQPASAAVPAAGPDDALSENPWVMLGATLLLHVVATAVALRLGMKIFYESMMAGGYAAIILVDALIAGVMTFFGPLTEGFTAMLGPQLVVTAGVMVLMLHRQGFTKAWFTVIPTVLVTKAFAFFGEVVLRMLFLEAMLRWAAARGW